MTEQEIYHYIEMTPFRGREPIFRGTKITVEHVTGDLAKGLNFEAVLKEHPQLPAKHLQAAFVYCRIALKEIERRRAFPT